MTRTNSDLAGSVSRQRGVTTSRVRQVCSGDTVPSCEPFYGIGDLLRIERSEACFTTEAPDTLDRALPTVPAEFEASLSGGRNLPPQRWAVLNGTVNALRQLDDREEDA